MATTMTIISAAVLLLLAGLGAWRGPLRSLLALLGTLLGALLADIWAPTWGGSLVQQFGIESRNTVLWVMACATFLLTTLLAGYGAGLLVPRARPTIGTAVPAGRRMSLGSPLPRLLGLLLGLLNAALILGFLFAYTTALLKSEAFAGLLLSAPLIRLLRDGLGWVLLGLALLIAASVIIRIVVDALQRTTRRPTLESAPTTPADATRPSGEPKARV